jgi:hypothetical protein
MGNGKQTYESERVNGERKREIRHRGRSISWKKKKDESGANLFQFETQKVIETKFNEKELQGSKSMTNK